MLTTLNEEGFLHSRPMGVLKVRGDGVVYFFSRDPSFKTEDLRQSTRVNLGFSLVPRMRFASLCGSAEISRDHRLLSALWDESLREWFPAGIKDPALAVLIVSPECFDLWDGMMHIHSELVS
jgi:general stress protein 26